MFENFKVPKFYLANRGPLSIYASGKTTGMAFNSGNTITNVIPVFEGNTLYYAGQRNKLAG